MFDNKKYTEWNIDEEPINFPDKIRIIYERNYIKNRVQFTNWIDSFSKKHSQDIDWWMTLPSTRDPYKSNLLNYICIIDTLKKIQIKNIKIKTKSKEFAKILNQEFKILVEIKKKRNFFSFKSINNFIKSVLFQLILFLYINLFIKKKNVKKNKIGLVDIFLSKIEDQNKNFYPNLDKSRKSLDYFFVPTFVPTFNILKIFKIINNLKRNKSNFLFKEHYLKIGDLIFSFLHIFRRNKFLKKTYYYKKINLSKIVNNEIISNHDFSSVFVGILNYRFFYKVSKNNLNIQKSINWFENQMVDKGWNLGFRQFFKNFEKNSYGNQDYSKHYNMINNSPSKSESDGKVVPKNIIVISKLFLKTSKEFYKKQKVLLGNSWRFRNINKLRLKLPDIKKRKKILLVLSGIEKIDKILLDYIIKVSLSLDTIKIFVKPHPILEINKVVPLKNLPRNIVVTHDNLQNTLSKTLIVITSGPSSTILESSSLGLPLILPNIEAGTDKNAQRHQLNKKSYFIVNNENELLTKIKKLNKIKLNSSIKNNKSLVGKKLNFFK